MRKSTITSLVTAAAMLTEAELETIADGGAVTKEIPKGSRSPFEITTTFTDTGASFTFMARA